MYEYKAKVVKVVDGDTVDLDIDVGFNITIRQRVRLMGIDTPESRTKDLVEKEKGLKAKHITEGYALKAKETVVKTYKDDKYGRMLVDLVCDGVNVNQKLIDGGFAWNYDGGHKDKDLTKLI